MNENLEQHLVMLNNQAEMLRETLEDKKLNENSRLMIEQLLENTEETIGKLCSDEDDEQQETNSVKKVRLSETLTSSTDVSKYIRENSDTLLDGYKESEKKAFIDGAKWLFSAFSPEIKYYIEKLKKFKDYINKLTIEINDYREMFEPKSYTTTKKSKRKKSVKEEESETYDEENEFSEESEEFDY